MPQNFKSLTRVGVKRRRVETSQNRVPKNVPQTARCQKRRVSGTVGKALLTKLMSTSGRNARYCDIPKASSFVANNEWVYERAVRLPRIATYL